MHHLDLTGLEHLTLTDTPPVIHEGAGGHRPNTAHCPQCGDLLLDFLHDDRLLLWCERCKLLWPTRLGPSAPTDHRKLVAGIVPVELVRAA